MKKIILFSCIVMGFNFSMHAQVNTAQTQNQVNTIPQVANDTLKALPAVDHTTKTTPATTTSASATATAVVSKAAYEEEIIFFIDI